MQSAQQKYSKRYYEKNKEAVKARAIAWVKNHPERAKAVKARFDRHNHKVYISPKAHRMLKKHCRSIGVKPRDWLSDFVINSIRFSNLTKKHVKELVKVTLPADTSKLSESLDRMKCIARQKGNEITRLRAGCPSCETVAEEGEV
jgi:hypothetical protein